MVGVQLVDGYSMRSEMFRGHRYDCVIAQYNGVDIYIGLGSRGQLVLISPMQA